MIYLLCEVINLQGCCLCLKLRWGVALGFPLQVWSVIPCCKYMPLSSWAAVHVFLGVGGRQKEQCWRAACCHKARRVFAGKVPGRRPKVTSSSTRSAGWTVLVAVVPFSLLQVSEISIWNMTIKSTAMLSSLLASLREYLLKKVLNGAGCNRRRITGTSQPESLKHEMQNKTRSHYSMSLNPAVFRNQTSGIFRRWLLRKRKKTQTPLLLCLLCKWHGIY